MGKRRRVGAGGGGRARKDADLELPPGHGSLAAEEVPRFIAPVDVYVTHYRHTLADPQGASTKYCLDAVVRAGILADDSAREIREIRDRQKKIPQEAEERTEIDLRRCDLGPPEGWP